MHHRYMDQVGSHNQGCCCCQGLYELSLCDWPRQGSCAQRVQETCADTYIIACDAGITVLAAVLVPSKAHYVSFVQMSDCGP